VTITFDVSLGPARSVSRSRRVRDGLATAAIWASVAVVLVPLVLLVVYVFRKGAGIMSLDFLTRSIPISRAAGPGMGPAVLGTLVITGGAIALAVPLGVLGGIWLSEYGRGTRLAGLVRFLANVMTGVPSIVMGLFIYTVWVLRYGQSGFAGSLALAALMLPVVIRTTETMLQLVPDVLREASFALGARRARTVLTVVLPAAVSGIVSGALLAVARAAGETAPLLFTVGIVTDANPNLFNGSNTALSVQIFRNAQFPFVGAQQRAWGAALTLVVLVFVFTAIARVISAHFARQQL
jgi:phosphate transport system permease protein